MPISLNWYSVDIVRLPALCSCAKLKFNLMLVKRLVILITSTFLFLFFFSSVAYAQDSSPSNLDCLGGFFDLFPGNTSIKYKPVTFSSPRRIPAHIVKVNLNDPNIDTATTPRQWLGNTTSGFLSMVGGGVLAINGSGYLALNDPMGFNASQEDVYSGSQGDGGMIYSSSEDNSVERIAYSLASDPPWDVLSGVNLLVEGGNIYDKLISCTNPNSSICIENDCDSYCTIRARTSIGMTGSNQLIIIVTEEGSSQLLDMAEMMEQCGVVNAMNMDGGNSSTLAADPSNITGRSVINTLAGSERTVSNHLAICFGTCDVPVSAENEYIPEGSPFPQPPVPCNETRWPEFHSLRPYQASPCNRNKEDLALFCGNDLFVGNYETILKLPTPSKTYTRNGSPIYPNPPISNLVPFVCYYCSSEQPEVCLQNPNTPCIYDPEVCTPGIDLKCGWCQVSDDARRETCAFTITGSKSVAVDVSGAEFPIMGYTEPSSGNDKEYKVINSQNTSEENMDHATKMNEYVSWYLNGVNGRAEYSYLNPDLQCVGETSEKVGTCLQTQVNSDGGLDCLGTWGIPFMPPFIQVSLMTDGKSVCTGEKNYCCVSKYLPSHTDATPGSGNLVNYSGPIKKLLPFSLQNIERINEVNDASASVHNNARIRHNQVVGCETSSIINILLEIVGLGNNIKFTRGVPTNCYGKTFLGYDVGAILDGILTNYDRLTDFVGHLPPIEEMVPYFGQDFNRWLIAFKRWRGNACIPIHLRLPFGIEGLDFTFNYCFDNPLSPNIFGNLFSYIPFSSTEDRMGDVRIKSGSFVPYSPYVNIIWSQVTPKKDADLFVPHMEEDTQLANLLQKTFAYKDADLTSMENSGFIPDSPYCEFRETRSNPGDELFAGELAADISYAAQITCNFLNFGGQNTKIGVPAPWGNLCENQLNGTCLEIVPPSLDDGGRWLYINENSNYGQYDCAPHSLCVVGREGVDYDSLTSDVGCTGGGSRPIGCFPHNFIGSDGEGCHHYEGPNQCPKDDLFVCAYYSSNCVRPENIAPPPQYCTNAVLANLNLEDRTPLAREAWSRLVAGSAGVFRKMFPQIGSDGSEFDGIIDMPASTDVSYRAVNPDGSPDNDSIVYVGNPSNQTPGSQAKLYFPHIGGIKEYFLTGIQTLLRPKGMGNQPVFCEGDECKEGTGIPPLTGVPIPPGSQVCDIACENDALSMITPGLVARPGQIYQNTLRIAQNWTLCGWVGSIGQRSFDQLYDKIVADSIAAGVNPVFSLAIWLNEWDASNYEGVCECNGNRDVTSVFCNRAQDFGQNYSEYETVFRYDAVAGRASLTCNGCIDRFDTQLSRFLNRPLAYQTYCASDNFACPWEQFGALFHYGQCYSSTAANNYILEIREFYRWLAGNLAFPCYPISI